MSSADRTPTCHRPTRRGRTTAPSGTIIPPPMRPPARPIITPRTSGFGRMNRRPSTMSCQVCEAGHALQRTPIAFVEPQARDQEGGHEEGQCVDPDRRATLVDAERAEVVKVAEPLRDARENGEEHGAERERAVRRDRARSEFADARCSGSLTTFGTLASLAGPHRRVSISIRNEMTTSPKRLSQNGSTNSNPARPMSQVTMTDLAVPTVEEDASDGGEHEARGTCARP